MRKVLLFLAALLILPSVVHAQDQFYRAKVEQIIAAGTEQSYGLTTRYQKVKLLISDGDMAGQEITIDYGQGANLDATQLVKPSETVEVVKTEGPDNSSIYQITDKYRLDKIWPIIAIFFAAVVLLSGWKGVGSILGMIISLGVIIKFIVPQILAGHDPLLISILGCLIIMVTTIYLAHGFSKKTTIALIATFTTLVAIGLMSIVFVRVTSLSGLGSDDAYSLQLGPTASISLRGLLLGGILIGTLGVLDDVTTGLSASVFELAKANPKYNFSRLFKSGLVIGREHIASLVNTLVLAYAGVSLPIFITLILNPNNYPLWTSLNSELIIEEVVRTLAGSIGLIAAVPLTTFLAAWYLSRKEL